MRTMHLFAGAGGGLLCDLILGHKPIVAVEWDSYCCRVLRQRAADGWFPSLSVHEGDIRLFNPSEYKGAVDCIHAGFPCTDLSSAGKQAGIGEETRSGLYREVLRIASDMGFPDLFLENVPDVLSLGLGTILADLSSMGYVGKWLCIQASDVGANHERDRWFLYATSRDSNSKSTSSVDDETSRMQEFSESYAANTYCSQRQGGELSVRTHQEHTNFSGCPWWQDQPAILGVDDVVANRSHRLKAIGNGQVPLQAALAWRILSA